VNTFGKHGGTSGECSGEKLCDSDEAIAGQGCVYDFFRRCGHWLKAIRRKAQGKRLKTNNKIFSYLNLFSTECFLFLCCVALLREIIFFENYFL
jgi:hypothetical protein